MKYNFVYKDRSQRYQDRLMIEADSKQEAEQIFWQGNGDDWSSEIINIIEAAQ